MNKILLATLLSLALTGCATTLSPEASAVRVLNFAPKNCTEVGRVHGIGLKAGGNSNYAQVDRLRTRTVALGGNALFIDSVNGEGYKKGSAYKCS